MESSHPASSGHRRLVFATTVDFQLRYHQGLYQRLREEGWEVHIVSTGGPLLEALADDGFATHQVKMERSPSMRDFRAIREMNALIRRLRPDVVIAGSPKASLLAMITARLNRVPARVYVVWGVRSEAGSRVGVQIARAGERATIASASHVVAVSRSVRSTLIASNLVSADRTVDLVANGSTAGIDLDRFRPAASPAPRTRIGFVGRVTADKGVTELAEALEMLVGEGRKLELVVAGPIEDSEGREAIARMRRAGLSEVTVSPYVLDPRPILESVGLLCLPSYREGLPNVVLEAFAMGVPVVASSVTGVTDLVRDGVTGRTVAPRSAAALARGIAAALDDPARTTTMARAAREFAAEAFSAEVVFDAWAAYVDALK
ncbi:glycosyltransferase [Microbacterium sp. PRC9]|uniref:glycosyltransferase n=1 Tax=Microbacterium sp. PRC9 TaxID=2962591 RepID=UPI002882212F|nr:glycosyltransferase [Microbacterium sp. PRC9]MDT0141479.1 glycosyltransferase [Microbacterium sp. PRC9]